jgi:hypothetical protein
MNAAMTTDITRAISTPSKRSRTMAVATIRGPAAPKPCSTRPSSSASKLPAAAESAEPAAKQASPR